MVGKNQFVLQPTVSPRKQPVQDAVKLGTTNECAKSLRPKFGTVVSAENQGTTKCLAGVENILLLATPMRSEVIGWEPMRLDERNASE